MGRNQKNHKRGQKKPGAGSAQIHDRDEQHRVFYRKGIEAIQNRLEHDQLNDVDLQRIESDLEKLADTYQEDESLGAKRYKLYAAKAKLEYFRGDNPRAQAFMEEAVRIKGSSFAMADELLGKLQEPRSSSFLTKLSNLRNWQAALIILLVGFATFFAGLKNQFQGDDFFQIVNSLPVHSISHLPLFFRGGTFYNNGGPNAALTGDYYRPLMTTVFSIIYTLFGAHTFYYHLVQLLLCIGSAIILYLVFRLSFGTILALSLALVFLVHPINSQIVYGVPSMQDALFFFFGILGFYVLLRSKSESSTYVAVLCFFLSLLSKEAGWYFIIMAALYIYWREKSRLSTFLGAIVVPVAVWLVLRISAVGLTANTHLAPIDNLTLAGRLMNVPSVMFFYVTKFIFPWKLASGYYWVYPHFSVQHVLLPLIIDTLVIGLVIYVGSLLHRKASQELFHTYLFFAVWATLGLITVLQIVPMDMTACENWFYFSSVGVLGMIGVVLLSFQSAIKPMWFIPIVILIIGAFGVRTALRATDWSSPTNLAMHDIKESQGDYTAYYQLALGLRERNDFADAIKYNAKSIAIYPTFSNYNNMGIYLSATGEYPQALAAYQKAITYDPLNTQPYENITQLTLLYGNYQSDRQVDIAATDKFPHSSALWMNLALLEDKNGDNQDAKVAIQNAAKYGPVPNTIYDNIMSNATFSLTINGINRNISILF